MNLEILPGSTKAPGIPALCRIIRHYLLMSFTVKRLFTSRRKEQGFRTMSPLL
jgi:hypothetical protein